MPVYRFMGLQQSKNCIYGFRKVVPKKLRRIVGRDEIKDFLHTKDLKEATIRVREPDDRVRSEFPRSSFPIAPPEP